MSAILDDQRSLGELFSELANETRQLIRQEVALARTEIGEKTAIVGRNVAFAATGALVLLLGLLPLIAALIIALGHKIGYANASLIIGAILAAGGAALIVKAKNALRRVTLAPVQTTEQVKETTKWAKEQIR
jgi:hypothetical protein